MGDLEERLRTAVVRRSEGFDPSPDLPDRIHARVRHRRRARQLTTGGLVAAAAAAVLAMAVTLPGGSDRQSIRTTNPDRPDVQEPDHDPPRSTTSMTSTTVPEGGSRPSPSSSSSITSTTTAPPGPPIPTGPPLDTLTRQGVGPITAGMTLRQAQEAAGAAITPAPGGSATCVEAQIEGLAETGLVLVVEPAPPGADVMDGIVRATAGSVLPSQEGAMVGQTRTELIASLGQPTGVESDPTGLGGEVLLFQAGGHAYGALVVDDMVYGLQSGDPAWVTSADGCP